MKAKNILFGTAALCGAALLTLRGRTGHPGLEALRGWGYAHRGLHGDGVPENSMAAFKAALDHGYGIELDIHLLKDGNLAVIHDASLKRTAGADVELVPLFNSIQIPATATGDEMATLGNVQVVVNAHAIQAAGFADTVDPATGTVTATAQANAWAAFSAQTQTNP